MKSTPRTRTKTVFDSPSASDNVKSMGMKSPAANTRKEPVESHRGRALEPNADSPGPNTQWEKSEHDGLLTFHDGRKWWFHCQCCDYLNDRLYHTKMHYQRIHVQEGKAMTRKRKYPGSESGSLPAVPIVKATTRSPRVKKEPGETSPKSTTPKPRVVKSSPSHSDAKTPVRTPVAAKGSNTLASPKRTKLYAGASPQTSPSKAKGDPDALVFTFGSGRIERDGLGCEQLTGLSVNAAHLKRPENLKKSTPRRSGKHSSHHTANGSARSTPLKRSSKTHIASPDPSTQHQDRPQTPVHAGISGEEMFSPDRDPKFPFSPMPYEPPFSPDARQGPPPFKFDASACPASPPLPTRALRMSNHLESPRRLFQSFAPDKLPSVPNSPFRMPGQAKSREGSVDFTSAVWRTPTSLAEHRPPIFHRPMCPPTPTRMQSPAQRSLARGCKVDDAEGFESLECLEDLSFPSMSVMSDLTWTFHQEVEGHAAVAEDMTVPCA